MAEPCGRGNMRSRQEIERLMAALTEVLFSTDIEPPLHILGEIAVLTWVLGERSDGVGGFDNLLEVYGDVLQNRSIHHG